MNNKVFMNEIIYCNLKKRIIFYNVTIGMCGIIVGSYLIFDRLFPYSQVLAEILLMSIGILILGRFYLKKEKYSKVFGREEAYNKAFLGIM